MPRPSSNTKTAAHAALVLGVASHRIFRLMRNVDAIIFVMRCDCLYRMGVCVCYVLCPKPSRTFGDVMGDCCRSIVVFINDSRVINMFAEIYTCICMYYTIHMCLMRICSTVCFGAYVWVRICFCACSNCIIIH